VERFGLRKLNVVKAKEQHQFDISNRFAAVEHGGGCEHIHSAWESVRVMLADTAILSLLASLCIVSYEI
jgi:hypothetical protein